MRCDKVGNHRDSAARGHPQARYCIVLCLSDDAMPAARIHSPSVRVLYVVRRTRVQHVEVMYNWEGGLK